MSEYKSVDLSELLEESDYAEVVRLIQADQWKELRAYLNSIKDKLIKQGVVADYLYYYLEFSFKYNGTEVTA